MRCRYQYVGRRSAHLIGTSLGRPSLPFSLTARHISGSRHLTLAASFSSPVSSSWGMPNATVRGRRGVAVVALVEVVVVGESAAGLSWG